MAIVPGKAKSAGTIICMGASKILMAAPSELGPVDAQIIKEENGVRSVFSAHGLVQGYDRIFKEAVAAAGGHLEPYIQQLANYDDREINAYRSVIALADSIAVKVLRSGMLSDKTDDEIKTAIQVFLDPKGRHFVTRSPYFRLRSEGVRP